MSNPIDIAIVGGGAAGLMSAIWAARTNPHLNIVIFDGAKKLGAKILVAGGGRCNVTHHSVSPEDFAGRSQNSIKKVLLRFDVKQTVEFFGQIGVQLKLEQTGKLFPVSDSARDVLKALLDQVNLLGVQIYCNHRVESIDKDANGFSLKGEWGNVLAKKLIIATGGKSLPKSGSNGKGYEFCQQFGHLLSKNIIPALVPLLLPTDNNICQISGVSTVVKLNVVNSNNKTLKNFTNSMLCTHFGISGPVVLDISRYFINAQREIDVDAKLLVNWLPDLDEKLLEDIFIKGKDKRAIRNLLGDYLPDRLAQVLCEMSKIVPTQKSDQLGKIERKQLLRNIYAMNLPVTGDRGFQFAEVTAGGVPLSELDLKTMQSRLCPDLYLCGEVCDVDGRIGGFNFQWAWASGYVCGKAIASSG